MNRLGRNTIAPDALWTSTVPPFYLAARQVLRIRFFKFPLQSLIDRLCSQKTGRFVSPEAGFELVEPRREAPIGPPGLVLVSYIHL